MDLLQSSSIMCIPESPAVPEPKAARYWRWSLSALRFCLLALLLLAVGLAYNMGLLMNALFVFLLIAAPIAIALLIWRAIRRTAEYGLLQTPLAGRVRLFWLQALNAWFFWLAAAWTVQTCVVPAQFTPAEYRQVLIMTWGSAVILILLELVPGKRISVISNLALAAGWLFLGVEHARVYWPGSGADAFRLQAPFQGEWLVIQGGSSALVNHHFPLRSQRNALDIERVVNGLERAGPAGRLESYPSWGQTLFAPVTGKVVNVVSNLADNAIGRTDDENVAGNYVVIEAGKGRFVLMAHLQHGSVCVAPGDPVRAGQPIASCGNSGNTSQPHLHIQVQNQPDFYDDGVETYPILFTGATRLRQGHSTQNAPLASRRNDLLLAPH